VVARSGSRFVGWDARAFTAALAAVVTVSGGSAIGWLRWGAPAAPEAAPSVTPTIPLVRSEGPVPPAAPTTHTSTAIPATTIPGTTIPATTSGAPTTVATAPDAGDAPRSARPECAGGTRAEDLDRLLRMEAPHTTGVVGADYPRVHTLPDGRLLWLFQDAFVGTDADRLETPGNRFAHNIGLVQDGACFTVLGGTDGSWIGADREIPLRHWFWPLGTVTRADGRLGQFMVEMRNPNGTGADLGAEPVAVWLATIDLTDFSVDELAPAPDPLDRPLFGFSVTGDDRYDYLYGQCYRQFADPGYVGYHDLDCGPDVYLARVPHGQPEVAPEYWAGGRWSNVRADAIPVSTRGAFANALQVRRFGDRFVAVNKVDDWWGHTIEISVASAPQGPFALARTVPEALVCGGCNTYFAHLLPWKDPGGALIVVLSNNAWDMRADAFGTPSRYRPSVFEVPLRDVAPPRADGRGAR
jgi:hypothetical protein